MALARSAKPVRAASALPFASLCSPSFLSAYKSKGRVVRYIIQFAQIPNNATSSYRPPPSSARLCLRELHLEGSDGLLETRTSQRASLERVEGGTYLGRVESLRASLGAVEDGVAAVVESREEGQLGAERERRQSKDSPVDGEGVLELGETLGGLSITRVGDPAVGL